jgi:cystathionine gamma-synthase
MKLQTRAVHAGAKRDATGAVAPPIHLSTTFERDELLIPVAGYTYIRDGNPTEQQLESALAAMDRGEAAVVFASGMAAAAAMMQTVPPGTHILVPDDGYYGVRVLAREFVPQWGRTAEIVDMTDLDAVRRAAHGRSTLIWAETPSNPLMRITDLRALSALARESGALLLVDGTFATPILQRPLELGADIVLHATTKYIGGHSDLQGGALVFRSHDLAERVRHVRHITGGVSSPFNSWLALRGLRSLAARMRLHCENGMAVARFLAGHPAVRQTYYPGLESATGHELARDQMSDFGGMLSFSVAGGKEAAIRVVSRVRLFTRATSLGGVESLIEHRATSEGAGSTAPDDLIRISVGLEHADDLIADLEHALKD